MFKKIFLPVIYTILLTYISASCAAPKPLVNIGNTSNASTNNGLISTTTKLTVGALAASGIGFAIYEANRDKKPANPSSPPPSPSPTHVGKIFLIANNVQLYSMDQNASTTTAWTQIGAHPTDVDEINGFSISPNGNTIFIDGYNNTTNNDQIYKVATNATTTWTQIGARPTDVDEIGAFSLSPDGSTVFIDGYNNTTDTDQMYKVAANAPATTSWTQIGARPAGVDGLSYFALSSDGSTVFIEGYNSTTDDDQMYKVAVNTPATTAWTQIGARPTDVDEIDGFSLSPDGNTAFIDDYNSSTDTDQMYKVSANTPATTAWTQIGTRPTGVDEIDDFSLSPDGSTVFIHGYNSSTVTDQMYKVATNTPATTAWTQIGTRPTGVDRFDYFALSPDGGTVFLGGYNNAAKTGQMYKVATNTPATIAWTQIGTRPTGVDRFDYFALSPDGGTIFLGGYNNTAKTSQMYRVAANATTTTACTQIGARPTEVDFFYFFILSSNGNNIFVNNYLRNFASLAFRENNFMLKHHNQRKGMVKKRRNQRLKKFRIKYYEK